MTEQEPSTPIDHTQRAIDEVFGTESVGQKLSNQQFLALGGLAGRIILSNEFEAASTLYRDLQNRVASGVYDRREIDRLNGIADVVGSIARYEPARISIDEYSAMASAVGQFSAKAPSPRIRQLWDRGLVSIRRAGDFYAVELSPKGQQAKTLFENKPSI